MTVVLEDARNLLRTLIRSIDKKVEFSASLNAGDRPGVAVTLSLHKNRATIVISEEQLNGVEQDSIRRAQLEPPRSLPLRPFRSSEGQPPSVQTIPQIYDVVPPPLQ